MLFKLIIILLFIYISSYLIRLLKIKRKKNFFKAQKFTTFNKKNLNDWMNLTKKERYNLSKQDSVKYMDRRKILLEEIRKEYEEISRESSNKNIKKK